MASKRSAFLNSLRANVENAIRIPPATSLAPRLAELPDARGFKGKVLGWGSTSKTRESEPQASLPNHGAAVSKGASHTGSSREAQNEAKNSSACNGAASSPLIVPAAAVSKGASHTGSSSEAQNEARNSSACNAAASLPLIVPGAATTHIGSFIDEDQNEISNSSPWHARASSPLGVSVLAVVPSSKVLNVRRSLFGNESPVPTVSSPQVVRRSLLPEGVAVTVDCNVLTSPHPPEGGIILSQADPDELLLPLEQQTAEITNSLNETESLTEDVNLIQEEGPGGNNDLGENNSVQEPEVDVLRTPTNNSTLPFGSSRRKRTRASGGSSSPVRKRSTNSSLWKANVRKTLKNSGQAYTSARGKPMKGAQMRNPCSCHSNCRLRVTEENRKEQFTQFWSTGDHERQWEFIRQNSSSKPPDNSRPDFKDKKKCSRSYFFVINGERVMVCKKMFMATYGIWDSWIDSAYKHLNPAKGNTRTPDKRGRHKNHYVAVTPQKIESVKEHCNLFPRVPSHYCRQRSKREYLEHGLSQNKMAKLYIKWAHDKGLPKAQIATIRQYKDIINSHFNIGFYKPKKDQCGLCSTIRSKHNPRHIREKYKDVYSAHILRKQLVKKLKLQDRNTAEKDPKVATVSFDLQKQLPCPKSEVGDFFYRNKLSVLNFTVFLEVERLGNCYIWHEGMARKGSCEIASSLFHVIGKLVDSGHDDIRFYSDNCSGQNKNRFVFAMYQHAAVLKSIKITHRFLEPGHTHMDADTIHARIENATSLKEIMDFDDWVKEIENAKEELPMYNVVKLKQSMIFDYKDLVAKQNWKRDMKGQVVKWSKVREVSVDGREGNLVRIRYNLDGEITTLCPNARTGRPVNLKTYQPPKNYNGPIPLKANKRKDLEYLCDQMIIPFDKQPFFREVLAGTVNDDEDPLAEVDYDSDEEIITTVLGEVEEERRRTEQEQTEESNDESFEVEENVDDPEKQDDEEERQDDSEPEEDSDNE